MSFRSRRKLHKRIHCVIWYGARVSVAARPAAYRGVDPVCFSGSGPTHFLRWIVYYCVCIQHDIDKSQISFTELCKTSRTNSGLRAINSCLHLFWPHLCKACWVNIVLWQQNLKFSFHQQTVEFGPTRIFTQIYAPGCKLLYSVYLLTYLFPMHVCCFSNIWMTVHWR